MKDSNVVCPKCKTDNCPYNDSCIKCDQPLIGDEMRILDGTRNLWSKIIKLPESHPDERNDLKDAVHRIQDLIAFRIASKLTSGIFREWRSDRPTESDEEYKKAVEARAKELGI